MEHGSVQDPSKATFSFVDEDHTLANGVRFTLNQELVTKSFRLLYMFQNFILLIEAYFVNIMF